MLLLISAFSCQLFIRPPIHSPIWSPVPMTARCRTSPTRPRPSIPSATPPALPNSSAAATLSFARWRCGRRGAGRPTRSAPPIGRGADETAARLRPCLDQCPHRSSARRRASSRTFVACSIPTQGWREEPLATRASPSSSCDEATQPRWGDRIVPAK